MIDLEKHKEHAEGFAQIIGLIYEIYTIGGAIKGGPSRNMYEGQMHGQGKRGWVRGWGIGMGGAGGVVG